MRTIDHRELGFICLSGLATGASWLCYYRALQDGLASVVVPIDKLSILVTILFSYLVFHEELGKKRSRGSGTDCGGNAWDAGVVSLAMPFRRTNQTIFTSSIHNQHGLTFKRNSIFFDLTICNPFHF